MNKAINYLKSFVLTVTLIFVAFSCSNGSVESNNKAVVEVFVNSSDARSAVPVVPEGTVYVVTAVKGSEKITAEEVDSDTGAYKLELSGGKWQVSVKGSYNDDEILEGSSELTVSDTGRYYLTVPVYFIQQGSGSVNLSINVTGTSITKLVISGTGSGTDSNLDGTYSVTDGSITISKTGVNNNNYYCNLLFYDANEVLVLALRETINVRQNITTSTWCKNGSELYFKEKTGNSRESEFILTNESIKQIVNTTLFVSSTTGAVQTGSYYAPYVNMQHAVNKVIELNKLNNDVVYTIYVNGKVSGESDYAEIGSSDAPVSLKLNVFGFSDDAYLSNDSVSLSFYGTGKAAASLCIKDLKLDGLKTENVNLEISGKTSVIKNNITLKTGDFITVLDELKDSEGINIGLEKVAGGSLAERKVIQTGSDLNLDYELCQKFNILVKDGAVYENSPYYCVVPSKLDSALEKYDIGVLALTGAVQDKPEFVVPEYNVFIYGAESITAGNASSFTIDVMDNEGIPYTNVTKYYMVFMQNGVEIPATAVNEGTINLPDWLAPGNYEVFGSALINGVEYCYKKEFEIK